MKTVETYKNELNRFCKNLTLTTFPHAKELMFRNIFLNDIFFDIDLVENKRNMEFDYRKLAPDTYDVDYTIQLLNEALQKEFEKDDDNKEKSTKNGRSKIYITGSAGGGKSILMKRFVLACLNSEKESSEFLEKYNNVLNKRILNSLPVFIVLNKLQFISAEEINSLEFHNLIYKLSVLTLGDPFSSAISEKEFTEMLKATKEITFFFDGLDEVLSEEKRKIFLEKLDADTESNHFITSRCGDSDNNEPFFSDAKFFSIAEFNISKDAFLQHVTNIDSISDFAKRFYRVMYFNSPEQEKYNDFVKEVKNNSFLHSMIKTPFTLSLLLSLYIAKRSLTENRADLLSEYVNLFLSWYSKKSRGEARLSQTTITILLSYIALYMLKSNKTMLDENELCQVLSCCYRDLDGYFPEKMRIDDVKKYSEELLKVGILDTRFGKFGFSQHRLLLEFFAAKAISGKMSDDETYSMSPLEFFTDKFVNPKWREVIIYFSMMQPREAQIIIDGLISIVKNNKEENYFQSNLLFDLSCEVPMRASERHKVYDVLFKEHITDKQIDSIASLMSSNTIIAEDLYNYVREKFIESIRTDKSDCYGYAYAITEAYTIKKNNEDPFLKAEEYLKSSELTNITLGLEMLSTLAWCRYMNLSNMYNPFHEHCISKVSYKMREEAILVFRNLITNIESFCLSNIVARSFQDCVVAGFISFSDIVDYKLYKKLVQEYSRNSKKDYLRTILSVFDFKYSSRDIFVADNVKGSEQKKLLTNLREKNHEAVFDFSVCSALGVFVNCHIEKLFLIFENDQQDSIERARFFQLRHIFPVYKVVRDGMGEDDNIAVSFFDSQLSNSAKKYLEKLNENEPLYSLSANLSYYLRRGELKKVYVDYQETEPLNLLYADDYGDSLSLIEHALIISNVSKNEFGDINLGLEYLKKHNEAFKNNKNTIFHDLKRWVECEDILFEAESIIVCYFLWQLGCLRISDISQVNLLTESIASKEELCIKTFDFFLELTKQNDYFLKFVIQEYFPSIATMETNLLEANKEYAELMRFEAQGTEYIWLISIENPEEATTFRKILLKDGKQRICSLDESEYNVVFSHLIKELVKLMNSPFG